MLFSTMPPPRGTRSAFIGAARGALRAAAVEARRMVLMSFMVVYLQRTASNSCNRGVKKWGLSGGSTRSNAMKLAAGRDGNSGRSDAALHEW